jgi:nitroreductase/dihydropteridine reductase
MNIADIATHRYTTKVFDREKTIPAPQIAQLQTLLRFAPSSVNSQPWHFVVAASDEGKSRIARAAHGPYASNEPKILNASHVLVLCARTQLDDAHIQRILEQEEKDGRFDSPEAKAAVQRGRNFYLTLHREKLHDTQHWMEKQVYIALGMLLFGAGALGIDACPIEGFDRAVLDEVLGLKERGLRAVVLAALGYRGDDDFNAALPKSRLPEQDTLTLL